MPIWKDYVFCSATVKIMNQGSTWFSSSWSWSLNESNRYNVFHISMFFLTAYIRLFRICIDRSYFNFSTVSNMSSALCRWGWHRILDPVLSFNELWTVSDNCSLLCTLDETWPVMDNVLLSIDSRKILLTFSPWLVHFWGEDFDDPITFYMTSDLLQSSVTRHQERHVFVIVCRVTISVWNRQWWSGTCLRNYIIRILLDDVSNDQITDTCILSWWYWHHLSRQIIRTHNAHIDTERRRRCHH